MKIGEKSDEKDRSLRQESQDKSAMPFLHGKPADTSAKQPVGSSPHISNSSAASLGGGNGGTAANAAGNNNSNTLIFNTVVNVNLNNSQQNTQINSQQNNNISSSEVEEGEAPADSASDENALERMPAKGQQGTTPREPMDPAINKENVDPKLRADGIQVTPACGVQQKLSAQQQMMQQQMAQSMQSSQQIINPYQQAMQLNPFQQALKPAAPIQSQYMPYQQYLSYGQQQPFFYQHPNRIQNTNPQFY